MKIAEARSLATKAEFIKIDDKPAIHTEQAVVALFRGAGHCWCGSRLHIFTSYA